MLHFGDNKLESPSECMYPGNESSPAGTHMITFRIPGYDLGRYICYLAEAMGETGFFKKEFLAQ